MRSLCLMFLHYLLRPGIGTLVCNVILSKPDAGDNLQDIYDVLRWIFPIIPHYCLGFGAYSILFNGEQRQTASEYESLDCIANRCSTIEIAGAGFSVECPCYKDPFDWDISGWAFLYLGIEGAIFFAIALLIEYNEERIANRFSKKYNVYGLVLS